MLALVAAVMAVFGLVFAGVITGSVSAPAGTPDGAAMHAVGISMIGMNFAQLFTGVFGALAASAEFSTGVIGTTFIAEPRRWPVVVAKLAVSGVLCLLWSMLVCWAVFLAVQQILADAGQPAGTLIDAQAARAVFGTATYLAGTAVLGTALGFLLRSTAASISLLVGAMFVLPGLSAVVLPPSWQAGAVRLWPSEAGEAFATVAGDGTLLSPLVGVLVYAGWIAAAGGAATIVAVRRDV
jgi:ABC-type transport system involved in multi-copper enzyme maturation permease subunit